MNLFNIIKTATVLLFLLFCSSLFGQSARANVAPIQEQLISVKKGNDNTSPNQEEINDDVSDIKTLANSLNIDVSKLTLTKENYQFWLEKSKEIPYNNTYHKIILDHLGEIKLEYRKN